VRNRSGFTQSSDEVPIFASNQIVKDLCGHQRTSCDTRGTTGLETCIAGHPAKIRVRKPALKIEKVLKELPGRPYSARLDGSRRVLLPFLTRISLYYTTAAALGQLMPAPHNAARSRFLAARSEYQKASRGATTCQRFSAARLSARPPFAA